MARVTKRSYGQFCPLVEDFHIKNVMGCSQRRHVVFGDNITIPAGTTNTKAYTFSTFTGGLITEVSHSQILVQKLNAAPANRPRITSKSTTGFTLVGDGGASDVYYSVVVFATLPTPPRNRTPKWAKDYCPGCKNLDFWAIPGSIVKDLAICHFRVQNGAGGTLAVSFPTHTAYYGDETTDLYVTGVKGSEVSPLINLMASTDYQIIITPSASAPAAAPYPSSIARAGFTLTGDASEYFNILVLGQITN